VVPLDAKISSALAPADPLEPLFPAVPPLAAVQAVVIMTW
jgi:hypothetical protein